ncbi:conserved Plasmodium protein, unknown function [Plasmodium ovale curtisi]|uniref:Thioredoxin-like protein n=1 Tax=Plasmodium ovale curtisi TaxID=864141 RepID=A0A1A8WH92_PLAOA|nr:conserved Plasmodium protein, unknown function [Plasmodium ovale curtisi]
MFFDFSIRGYKKPWKWFNFISIWSSLSTNAPKRFSLKEDINVEDMVLLCYTDVFSSRHIIGYWVSLLFANYDNVAKCWDGQGGNRENIIISNKITLRGGQLSHLVKNIKLRNKYGRKRNSFFFLNFRKKKLPHLLCFHSEDCEYCNSMEGLLKKLKEEEDVHFLKLDVYENSYNFELLQQLDYDNLCGGLPYYYNLQTHYNICGATTYHNLRNWALNRKCNPNEPPNDEMKKIGHNIKPQGRRTSDTSNLFEKNKIEKTYSHRGISSFAEKNPTSVLRNRGSHASSSHATRTHCKCCSLQGIPQQYLPLLVSPVWEFAARHGTQGSYSVEQEGNSLDTL